jgi:DinB superfamily
MKDEGCIPPRVLREGRAAREELVAGVARLGDAALRNLVVRGGREVTLESLLFAHMALDHECVVALSEALAALGWDAPAAVRHLQWGPLAWSRLEAALAGVGDALLDGRPFAGEWSVRQQLAHIELTDVRYTIATQYAVTRRDGEPLLPPADAYPARAGDPTGTPGEPLAAIPARMRRVRAAAIAPLLEIAAEDLPRPAEWHTAEHSVGFRLHRFAAHDLELVTDIERTLAALGHRPTWARRIPAALIEGWGEIEKTLLGAPWEELYDATPPGGGLTVTQQIARLCEEDGKAAERISEAPA